MGRRSSFIQLEKSFMVGVEPKMYLYNYTNKYDIYSYMM